MRKVVLLPVKVLEHARTARQSSSPEPRARNARPEACRLLIGWLMLIQPEVSMNLSRPKIFLVVLVSTLACHNTAGPPTLPAEFVLDNINGRPLPTYLAPTPGPTATIFSASLALDGSGRAVMTEHRQDMLQGDRSSTNTLDYRINGNTIELGCFHPTPANLLCPAYGGTISSETLRLTIAPSQPIIYNYTVAPTL
jgi:hypothetical protein